MALVATPCVRSLFRFGAFCSLHPKGPHEIARRFWRHKHHGDDGNYLGNPVVIPRPSEDGSRYECDAPGGQELVDVISAVKPTSPNLPWPELPAEDDVCSEDDAPPAGVAPGSIGSVSSGADEPDFDAGEGTPIVAANATNVVPAAPPVGSRPGVNVGADTAATGSATRHVAASGLSAVAVVAGLVMAL